MSNMLDYNQGQGNDLTKGKETAMKRKKKKLSPEVKAGLIIALINILTALINLIAKLVE